LLRSIEKDALRDRGGNGPENTNGILSRPEPQASIVTNMGEISQAQAQLAIRRERQYLVHLRYALDHRDDIFRVVDRCDSARQASSEMMATLGVDETTATAVLLLRVKDFSTDHKRHLDERISQLSDAIRRDAEGVHEARPDGEAT